MFIYKKLKELLAHKVKLVAYITLSPFVSIHHLKNDNFGDWQWTNKTKNIIEKWWIEKSPSLTKELAKYLTNAKISEYQMPNDQKSLNDQKNVR